MTIPLEEFQQSMRELCTYILDSQFKGSPPPKSLTNIMEQLLPESSSSLITNWNILINEKNRPYEHRRLAYNGMAFQLLEFAIHGLQQDAELDENLTKKMQSVTRVLYSNIRLSEEYYSFRKTLLRIFSDDLHKTGLIDDFRQWSGLNTTAREDILTRLAHHLYDSAQGVMGGFDDVCRFVAFASQTGNELGLCFSTGILVTNQVVAEPTADLAIKAICHEALHMLDNAIKAGNKSDFEQDRITFRVLKNFRNRFPETYADFLYDIDVTEPFDEGNAFRDAVLSQVKKRKGSFECFKQLGF